MPPAARHFTSQNPLSPRPRVTHWVTRLRLHALLRAPHSGPPPSGHRVTHWVTRCRPRACSALPAFLFFAAFASSAPLWPRFSPHALAESAAASTIHADWPAGAVGDDWSPLPLGEREARFARDFPGRIGVFSTPDGRVFVLRHVARPTRKLHPAADCLRGLGYAVTPQPIFAQNDGVEWGEVRAARDNETLRVRERILGADARAWTDLSAWYWSAAFGRAQGPWLAITEISPVRQSAPIYPRLAAEGVALDLAK